MPAPARPACAWQNQSCHQRLLQGKSSGSLLPGKDADMIAQIVELVEDKAAEIHAGVSVSMDVTHGKAA